MGDTPSAPDRRVVVLGASNVVGGLGSLLEEVRTAWGSPADVLVAAGLGRSYGQASRVLGRSLSGITSCGLWRALEARRPAPTAALVTDVGNDILYGASVDDIVDWVGQCLERLGPLTERLVLTELPLQGIDGVGPLRYRVVRSLLFPRSSVSLSDARAAAHAVNDQLLTAGPRLGAEIVRPDPDWYGLDPVHVRRGQRGVAWQTYVEAWGGGPETSTSRLSRRQRLRLRTLLPERRRLFGIVQRKSQPTTILPDGSWLSLY